MKSIALSFVIGALLMSGVWWTSNSLNETFSSESSLEKFAMVPISNISDNWRSAYEAGDFEAMSDLYEADAWLMTRDRPALKNRDEILAYFKNARQSGVKASIEFEVEDRVFAKEYVFQTAMWWLEIPQKDGENIRDAGRSLVIFKRSDDGKWRIWRDIDNHTPDVTFEMKNNDL